MKRNADVGNDLWSVFNRIQENATQGGQRYYKAQTPSAENNYRAERRMKTREVKGIDQNTRLNRELWALATKMAELKDK